MDDYVRALAARLAKTLEDEFPFIARHRGGAAVAPVAACMTQEALAYVAETLPTREEIEPYLGHVIGCPRPLTHAPCSCGLTALLARLRVTS